MWNSSKARENITEQLHQCTDFWCGAAVCAVCHIYRMCCRVGKMTLCLKCKTVARFDYSCHYVICKSDACHDEDHFYLPPWPICFDLSDEWPFKKYGPRDCSCFLNRNTGAGSHRQNQPKYFHHHDISKLSNQTDARPVQFQNLILADALMERWTNVYKQDLISVSSTLPSPAALGLDGTFKGLNFRRQEVKCLLGQIIDFHPKEVLRAETYFYLSRGNTSGQPMLITVMPCSIQTFKCEEKVENQINPGEGMEVREVEVETSLAGQTEKLHHHPGSSISQLSHNISKVQNISFREQPATFQDAHFNRLEGQGEFLHKQRCQSQRDREKKLKQGLLSRDKLLQYFTDIVKHDQPVNASIDTGAGFFSGHPLGQVAQYQIQNMTGTNQISKNTEQKVNAFTSQKSQVGSLTNPCLLDKFQQSNITTTDLCTQDIGTTLYDCDLVKKLDENAENMCNDGTFVDCITGYQSEKHISNSIDPSSQNRSFSIESVEKSHSNNKDNTKNLISSDIIPIKKHVSSHSDKIKKHASTDTDKIKKHVSSHTDKIKKHASSHTDKIKKHASTDTDKIKKHVSSHTDKIKKHASTDTDKIKKHVSSHTDKIKKHLSTDTDKIKKHLSTDTDKIKKHLSSDAAKIKKHLSNDADKFKKHDKSNTDTIKKHDRSNTDTIEKHDRSNTDTIKKHGRSNTDTIEKHDRSNTDTIEKYDRSNTDTIEKHDRSNTDTIKKHGRSNTDTIEKHDRSNTDTIEKYDRSNTDTIEKHDRSNTDTIEKHDRSNTDTIKKHGSNKKQEPYSQSIKSQDSLESNLHIRYKTEKVHTSNQDKSIKQNSTKDLYRLPQQVEEYEHHQPEPADSTLQWQFLNNLEGQSEYQKHDRLKLSKEALSEKAIQTGNETDPNFHFTGTQSGSLTKYSITFHETEIVCGSKFIVPKKTPSNEKCSDAKQSLGDMKLNESKKSHCDKNFNETMKSHFDQKSMPPKKPHFDKKLKDKQHKISKKPHFDKKLKDKQHKISKKIHGEKNSYVSENLNTARNKETGPEIPMSDIQGHGRNSKLQKFHLDYSDHCLLNSNDSEDELNKNANKHLTSDTQYQFDHQLESDTQYRFDHHSPKNIRTLSYDGKNFDPSLAVKTISESYVTNQNFKSTCARVEVMSQFLLKKSQRYKAFIAMETRRKLEEKRLYECDTDIDSPPPPCYHSKKKIKKCKWKLRGGKRKESFTSSNKYHYLKKDNAADPYDACSEEESVEEGVWPLSASRPLNRHNTRPESQNNVTKASLKVHDGHNLASSPNFVTGKYEPGQQSSLTSNLGDYCSNDSVCFPDDRNIPGTREKEVNNDSKDSQGNFDGIVSRVGKKKKHSKVMSKRHSHSETHELETSSRKCSVNRSITEKDMLEKMEPLLLKLKQKRLGKCSDEQSSHEKLLSHHGDESSVPDFSSSTEEPRVVIDRDEVAVEEEFLPLTSIYDQMKFSRTEPDESSDIRNSEMIQPCIEVCQQRSGTFNCGNKDTDYFVTDNLIHEAHTFSTPVKNNIKSEVQPMDLHISPSYSDWATDVGEMSENMQPIDLSRTAKKLWEGKKSQRSPSEPTADLIEQQCDKVEVDSGRTPKLHPHCPATSMSVADVVFETDEDSTNDFKEQTSVKREALLLTERWGDRMDQSLHKSFPVNLVKNLYSHFSHSDSSVEVTARHSSSLCSSTGPEVTCSTPADLSTHVESTSPSQVPSGEEDLIRGNSLSEKKRSPAVPYVFSKKIGNLSFSDDGSEDEINPLIRETVARVVNPNAAYHSNEIYSPQSRLYHEASESGLGSDENINHSQVSISSVWKGYWLQSQHAVNFSTDSSSAILSTTERTSSSTDPSSAYLSTSHQKSFDLTGGQSFISTPQHSWNMLPSEQQNFMTENVDVSDNVDSFSFRHQQEDCSFQNSDSTHSLANTTCVIDSSVASRMFESQSVTSTIICDAESQAVSHISHEHLDFKSKTPSPGEIKNTLITPCEQLSTHTEKPCEQLSTHTEKPCEQLSSHTGTPCEQLSSHTGTPCEQLSSHTGTPCEQLSSHTGFDEDHFSEWPENGSWRPILDLSENTSFVSSQNMMEVTRESEAYTQANESVITCQHLNEFHGLQTAGLSISEKSHPQDHFECQDLLNFLTYCKEQEESHQVIDSLKYFSETSKHDQIDADVCNAVSGECKTSSQLIEEQILPEKIIQEEDILPKNIQEEQTMPEIIIQKKHILPKNIQEEQKLPENIIQKKQILPEIHEEEIKSQKFVDMEQKKSLNVIEKEHINESEKIVLNRGKADHSVQNFSTLCSMSETVQANHAVSHPNSRAIGLPQEGIREKSIGENVCKSCVVVLCDVRKILKLGRKRKRVHLRPERWKILNACWPHCYKKKKLCLEGVNFRAPKPLVSDKDKLVSDKDKLVSDKDKLVSDKDKLVSDKDKLVSDKDKLVSDKDKLVSDKDKLVSDKDKLVSDKDKLVSDKDKLVSDKDKLVSDKDKLVSDKDKLVSDKDKLVSDKDKLVSDKDKLVSSHQPAENGLTSVPSKPEISQDNVVVKKEGRKFVRISLDTGGETIWPLQLLDDVGLVINSLSVDDHSLWMYEDSKHIEKKQEKGKNKMVNRHSEKPSLKKHERSHKKRKAEKDSHVENKGKVPKELLSSNISNTEHNIPEVHNKNIRLSNNVSVDLEESLLQNEKSQIESFLFSSNGMNVNMKKNSHNVADEEVNKELASSGEKTYMKENLPATEEKSCIGQSKDHHDSSGKSESPIILDLSDPEKGSLNKINTSSDVSNFYQSKDHLTGMEMCLPVTQDNGCLIPELDSKKTDCTTPGTQSSLDIKKCLDTMGKIKGHISSVLRHKSDKVHHSKKHQEKKNDAFPDGSNCPKTEKRKVVSESIDKIYDVHKHDSIAKKRKIDETVQMNVNALIPKPLLSDVSELNQETKTVDFLNIKSQLPVSQAHSVSKGSTTLDTDKANVTLKSQEHKDSTSHHQHRTKSSSKPQEDQKYNPNSQPSLKSLSYKPKKSTESSSSDKPKKSTESSSSDKPKKSTESSLSDKPKKSTESSSSDKPKKSTESSSSVKPKKSTESSSSDKPKKLTESSSSDKLKKSTESSLSDKPKKSTESSSSVKPKKSTESSSTDKPKKSTDSSTQKLTSSQTSVNSAITLNTFISKDGAVRSKGSSDSKSLKLKGHHHESKRHSSHHSSHSKSSSHKVDVSSQKLDASSQKLDVIGHKMDVNTAKSDSRHMDVAKKKKENNQSKIKDKNNEEKKSAGAVTSGGKTKAKFKKLVHMDLKLSKAHQTSQDILAKMRESLKSQYPQAVKSSDKLNISSSDDHSVILSNIISSCDDQFLKSSKDYGSNKMDEVNLSPDKHNKLDLCKNNIAALTEDSKINNVKQGGVMVVQCETLENNNQVICEIVKHQEIDKTSKNHMVVDSEQIMPTACVKREFEKPMSPMACSDENQDSATAVSSPKVSENEGSETAVGSPKISVNKDSATAVGLFKVSENEDSVTTASSPKVSEKLAEAESNIDSCLKFCDVTDTEEMTLSVDSSCSARQASPMSSEWNTCDSLPHDEIRLMPPSLLLDDASGSKVFPQPLMSCPIIPHDPFNPPHWSFNPPQGPFNPHQTLFNRPLRPFPPTRLLSFQPIDNLFFHPDNQFHPLVRPLPTPEWQFCPPDGPAYPPHWTLHSHPMSSQPGHQPPCAPVVSFGTFYKCTRSQANRDKDSAALQTTLQTTSQKTNLNTSLETISNRQCVPQTLNKSDIVDTADLNSNRQMTPQPVLELGNLGDSFKSTLGEVEGPDVNKVEEEMQLSILSTSGTNGVSASPKSKVEITNNASVMTSKSPTPCAKDDLSSDVFGASRLGCEYLVTNMNGCSELVSSLDVALTCSTPEARNTISSSQPLVSDHRDIDEVSNCKTESTVKLDSLIESGVTNNRSCSGQLDSFKIDKCISSFVELGYRNDTDTVCASVIKTNDLTGSQNDPGQSGNTDGIKFLMEADENTPKYTDDDLVSTLRLEGNISKYSENDLIPTLKPEGSTTDYIAESTTQNLQDVSINKQEMSYNIITTPLTNQVGAGRSYDLSDAEEQLNLGEVLAVHCSQTQCMIPARKISGTELISPINHTPLFDNVESETIKRIDSASANIESDCSTVSNKIAQYIPEHLRPINNEESLIENFCIASVISPVELDFSESLNTMATDDPPLTTINLSKAVNDTLPQAADSDRTELNLDICQPALYSALVSQANEIINTLVSQFTEQVIKENTKAAEPHDEVLCRERMTALSDEAQEETGGLKPADVSFSSLESGEIRDDLSDEDVVIANIPCQQEQVVDEDVVIANIPCQQEQVVDEDVVIANIPCQQEQVVDEDVVIANIPCQQEQVVDEDVVIANIPCQQEQVVDEDVVIANIPCQQEQVVDEDVVIANIPCQQEQVVDEDVVIANIPCQQEQVVDEDVVIANIPCQQEQVGISSVACDEDEKCQTNLPQPDGTDGKKNNSVTEKLVDYSDMSDSEKLVDYSDMSDSEKLVDYSDMSDSDNEVLNSVTNGELLKSVTDGELLKSVTDGELLKTATDGELLKSVTDGELLKTATDGELLKSVTEQLPPLTSNDMATESEMESIVEECQLHCSDSLQSTVEDSRDLEKQPQLSTSGESVDSKPEDQEKIQYARDKEENNTSVSISYESVENRSNIDLQKKCGNESPKEVDSEMRNNRRSPRSSSCESHTSRYDGYRRRHRSWSESSKDDYKHKNDRHSSISSISLSDDMKFDGHRKKRRSRSESSVDDKHRHCRRSSRSPSSGSEDARSDGHRRKGRRESSEDDGTKHRDNRHSDRSPSSESVDSRYDDRRRKSRSRSRSPEGKHGWHSSRSSSSESYYSRRDDHMRNRRGETYDDDDNYEHRKSRYHYRSDSSDSHYDDHHRFEQPRYYSSPLERQSVDYESFPYNKQEFSRNVPDRGKNTEQISEDRRTRRAHPYSRPQVRERKEYATFNLAYKDLEELMLCMTTESFKTSNKLCSVQNKQDKRFRHYRFRRSSLSKLAEKEKPSTELIRPEDIPNLEKRKLLADKVENLSESFVDETAKKKLDEMMKIYPIKNDNPKSVNMNNNCSSESDVSKVLKGNDMDSEKTIKEVLDFTTDKKLPVPASSSSSVTSGEMSCSSPLPGLAKNSSQVCDVVKTSIDESDANIKTASDHSDVSVNQTSLDQSDVSGVKTSNDINMDTIADSANSEVNLCLLEQDPINIHSNGDDIPVDVASENSVGNTIKSSSCQNDINLNNSLSDMSLDDSEFISNDIFVNVQNDTCDINILRTHQGEQLPGSMFGVEGDNSASLTDLSLGDLNISSSDHLKDAKLCNSMLETVSKSNLETVSKSNFEKSSSFYLPEVALKNADIGVSCNETGHHNQGTLLDCQDNQRSHSSTIAQDLSPYMVYRDPSIKSSILPGQSLPTKNLKPACIAFGRKGSQHCKTDLKKNAEFIDTVSSLQGLSLGRSGSELNNSSSNKLSHLISDHSTQPESRKNQHVPGVGEISNQSVSVDSRFRNTFVCLPDSSCNTDTDTSKSDKNSSQRTHREMANFLKLLKTKISKTDQETSPQESSIQNCLGTMQKCLVTGAISEQYSEMMNEIKNSADKVLSSHSAIQPASLLASVQPPLLLDQTFPKDNPVCVPQKSGLVLKDKMPGIAVPDELQDKRKMRLTQLMNIYRTRLLDRQEKDELQKLLLANVTLTLQERLALSQRTSEPKSNCSGRLKLHKITLQAMNQDYKPNPNLIETLISCTSDPSRDPRLESNSHKKVREPRLAKHLKKRPVQIPLEPANPCPVTVTATCTDARDET